MNKKILITLAILLLTANIGEAKMTKEAHHLYKMGTACEVKQDYDNAIKYLEKAIVINGDDSVLYTKIAGLYSTVGDNTSALKYYKKALKLNPDDGFLYVSIGNILQSMGDYENAYNSYKQASVLCPDYKYNYLNLASVESYQKKYDDSNPQGTIPYKTYFD